MKHTFLNPPSASGIDHSLLPSIVDARLPAKYEAAKVAIAEAARIDECKDWADKSAALASYAKQSGDKTLEEVAMRIRARAIRRCGELLTDFEKAKGGKPFQKATGGAAPTSRKQAAEDAGLSKDRAVTAIRVANVPAESFEAQVESSPPSTITALAEQGKKPAPAQAVPFYKQLGMTIPEFQAGIHFGGAVKQFLEATRRYPIGDIVAGTEKERREKLKDKLTAIEQFVAQLKTKL